MRKLEDSLLLQLLKTRDVVMQYFRPMLQKYGITEQQWRILEALYEHGELEPKQLSEICHILGPSLTGVVNRLENNGYAVRRRPMEDQRRTLIIMTPVARAFISDLSPEVDAVYQRMRQQLTPELMDQLSELCQEIEQKNRL